MTMPNPLPHNAKIEFSGDAIPLQSEILSVQALSFLSRLAEQFMPEHQQLLAARELRQADFDQGEVPGFDPKTRDIREGDWQVAAIPAEVADRRTEITGPVSRKMVINALNSGAQVYMADFEDSTSPTWGNIIEGQINLRDAITRQIDFSTSQGKSYALNAKTAILMVRPRGLHLPERHLQMAGAAVPAALVDFGLFLFHNHVALKTNGSQPYFYLPKLQHHEEAAWWEKVISWSEKDLGITPGTVRVTVLIETLPAVFQMHEILHALRSRILGLNCGRWDYIFSYIKTFRNHADKVLPDRDQVGMTVPFLSNYSKLLIQTCHQHGAFAMGGMAAQIPIRGDEQANDAAMEKVRLDKQREASNGHDGTWVAHPGLEPMSRAEFDKVLTGPNQIDRKLVSIQLSAEDLITPSAGNITEAGVRKNIRVAIQYLAAWLAGNGCVPIDHLMEDAATAEIGRTQLWQWLQHGSKLENGQVVTLDWLEKLFEQETRALISSSADSYAAGITNASSLLFDMTSAPDLVEFLTLPAYQLLQD